MILSEAFNDLGKSIYAQGLGRSEHNTIEKRTGKQLLHPLIRAEGNVMTSP